MRYFLFFIFVLTLSLVKAENINVMAINIFNFTKQSNGIEAFGTVSALTINEEGQLKAYYGANYPGVSRQDVQTLLSLQEQTPVPLASIDVQSVLGQPFSLISDPRRPCVMDGAAGYFHREHFLIRKTGPPKYQVLVEYCNDAMTSLQIRNVP